jgi:hypothetical protein
MIPPRVLQIFLYPDHQNAFKAISAVKSRVSLMKFENLTVGASVRYGVVFQEVNPIIARREDNSAISLRGQLVQLQTDAVDERLGTHRFDNAAGPQNGQPTFDTKLGIKSPIGEFRARRDADNYGYAALVSVMVADSLDLRRNHLPRDAIDGGGAHRLVKTGLCNAADTTPPSMVIVGASHRVTLA